MQTHHPYVVSTIQMQLTPPDQTDPSQLICIDSSALILFNDPRGASIRVTRVLNSCQSRNLIVEWVGRYRLSSLDTSTVERSASQARSVDDGEFLRKTTCLLLSQSRRNGRGVERDGCELGVCPPLCAGIQVNTWD
jgi:hypothetical protein